MLCRSIATRFFGRPPPVMTVQRPCESGPESHFLDRASDRSAMIGSLVAGRWRIEGLLGVGGMATVYRAVHENNQRRVALKVLHRDLNAILELRERFFQEAYVSNQVPHPGTVKALDDGQLEDGTPFLVLEFLEGQTLEQRWAGAENRLPWDEVARAVLALLEILEAAHGHGVIHRDIKPDNVFLCRSGEVKLLDFGIAKEMDSKRGYTTQMGSTLGTPAFMPPEQARGHWGSVNATSDLWAVAAMMFTLLTGSFVHARRTYNEILLNAMTRPAPSIGSILPDLPAEVAAFIDRGLSFDQKDRHVDAAQMRRELLGLLGETAIPKVEDIPRSQIVVDAPLSDPNRSVAPAFLPTPVFLETTREPSLLSTIGKTLGVAAAAALSVSGYILSLDTTVEYEPQIGMHRLAPASIDPSSSPTWSARAFVSAPEVDPDVWRASSSAAAPPAAPSTLSVSHESAPAPSEIPEVIEDEAIEDEPQIGTTVREPDEKESPTSMEVAESAGMSPPAQFDPLARRR